MFTLFAEWIGDLISGGQVKSRAVVIQQVTGKPVQFKIMEPARSSLPILGSGLGNMRAWLMSGR